MKRREFLKAAAISSVAIQQGKVGFLADCVAGGEIARRPYKDGVELSIIGFGGIVVMGMEQKDADRMVADSVDRGVNYFDVAPSYGKGEAEEKLGPALKPHREKTFLACKTGMRDAVGAREELERSLKRLHTDHFDLYQLHGMTKMEDVEQVLAPGGAMELFEKAREEGKVRYLGFSAHSAEAAVALMDRYPFDSILFPINYVCYAEGNFGPQVVQKAKEKGVARLALKALAYARRKKGDEKKHKKCWYHAIDELELAQKALRFTLSEEVTAAVPPGDEGLYQMALDLSTGYRPLTAEERADLLAAADGVDPLFEAQA